MPAVNEDHADPIVGWPDGRPWRTPPLEPLLGWVRQGPAAWPHIHAWFQAAEKMSDAIDPASIEKALPAMEVTPGLRVALHDLVHRWSPDAQGLALMEGLWNLGASERIQDADRQFQTVLHAALTTPHLAPVNRLQWVVPLLDLGAKADLEDVHSVLPIDAAAALLEGPLPTEHEAAVWQAFDALARATAWRPGFNYGYAPAWSVAIALGVRAPTEQDPDAAERGRRMLSSLHLAQSPQVGHISEAYAPLAWWWTCAEEAIADADEALATLALLLDMGVEPLLDTAFRLAHSSTHMPFIARVLAQLATETPEAPGFAARTAERLFHAGLTLQARHPLTDEPWVGGIPEGWLHHWSGATGVMQALVEGAGLVERPVPRRPRL